MAKILPFAAAAAGFLIGGPQGAAAGFQLGGLLGGKQGAGSAPQVAPPAPVTQAPVDALSVGQKASAAISQSNNFDTQGGQDGEELDADQVKKRASLFGN